MSDLTSLPASSCAAEQPPRLQQLAAIESGSQSIHFTNGNHGGQIQKNPEKKVTTMLATNHKKDIQNKPEKKRKTSLNRQTLGRIAHFQDEEKKSEALM